MAGHSDLFTDRMIGVSARVYAAGTAPAAQPAFRPLGSNQGSVALPSNALVGSWVVEVRAQDPCDSQTVAQTYTVL